MAVEARSKERPWMLCERCHSAHWKIGIDLTLSCLNCGQPENELAVVRRKELASDE